jgi:hypothetical protein
MDNNVQEARRRHMIEINKYRAANQKASMRRDFDLYDPNSLKKDFPARVSDVDPRIGISSLQRFEGEDLGVLRREAYQKEQMRIWTEEQLFEKKTHEKALNDEKE